MKEPMYIAAEKVSSTSMMRTADASLECCNCHACTLCAVCGACGACGACAGVDFAAALVAVDAVLGAAGITVAY